MNYTVDAPLHYLDALVDALFSRDTVRANDLAKVIFQRGWVLANFPNPDYQNDVLQALAASSLEALVEVWAEPLCGRRDQAPDWCARVPAVQETYSLIPKPMRPFFASEPKNPAFAKRGIIAPRHCLYFS